MGKGGDKESFALRCWQVVLLVIAVIFIILGIMGFVGLIYANGGLSIALLVVGAIVFLAAGILAFIVAAKGRQSRPLVICFMIVMICFAVVAIIQIVLGAVARTDCRNPDLPLSPLACGKGFEYYFALAVILLFASVIGAAAAYNFWRMLRMEDEGQDKYVYLAEAAY